MAGNKKNNAPYSFVYHLRILVSLVVVELILIGLFQFWPASDHNISDNQRLSYNEDDIYLEDVIITRQQSSPAPPPRPQTPIPVPDETIIEEEITLESIDFSDMGDTLSVEGSGEEGNTDRIVEDPEVSPRVQHIVEAGTPPKVRQSNIQAKVWVRLLIDRQGKVEEANISEIELYDQESGEYQTVNKINYDIPEATLEAAMQWKFRPARQNGQPVKSYTRQVFHFGR